MLTRATRLLGLVALASCACALFGVANAGAAPLGMVCTTGTNGANFNLTTATGTIETPDGNSVFMWGYANANTGGGFQLPGPVLCVTQGQTVTVRLHNTLAENTSIVFPGQTGVSATGAAGLFTREATPGGVDATYTFTASQPGTYLYESGTDPSKQVEMGLYGAIVVRPLGHPDWAYGDVSTRFDPAREYLLIFHEIDPFLHHDVETGESIYDFNALHNRYFTITGRSFPDTIADNAVTWLPTQPYGSLIRVKPYNATQNSLPALVRVVNAGLLNHPFHPHGFHLRVIAQDGRRLLTPAGADASSEHFGDVIGSGQTQDTLFKYIDQDNFSPQNALPVTIPSYRNLAFKDNVTWYSGSAYLGLKGTLPTGVTSYNVCGEFYFPWHSHALNEFTNFDEGFGGMATLLRVDPLPGCTGYPTSTTINSGGGTLRAGSYAALATDDATYYQVNSTTVAPFKTDWYAGFTGVPTGSQNLKVTYKGKNSISCTQTLYVWRWTTSSWVQIDSRAVGTSDVLIADVPPPGAASSYIGTGVNTGRVRVRVACQGGAAFFASGNFMKVVYDAP
jgi:multicopper oxidase